MPKSVAVKETTEQYPSSEEITRIRPSSDHAMSVIGA